MLGLMLRFGLGLGLAVGCGLVRSLSSPEGLRQGAGEEAAVVGVEDYGQEDHDVCRPRGCPRVYVLSRGRRDGWAVSG